MTTIQDLIKAICDIEAPGAQKHWDEIVGRLRPLMAAYRQQSGETDSAYKARRAEWREQLQPHVDLRIVDYWAHELEGES